MTTPPARELFPIPTRVLALLFLFVSALSVWNNAFHLRQMDFISFWAASVLALDGNPAGAYDIAVHKAVQTQFRPFASLMPFPYPPPFLLLVLPIGLIPYVLAAPLWIVGTFAAYAGAARRLLPHSAWLVAAFPPVLVNGITGQNGFLTAALFIAGGLALPTRPFLAGLLLGCLIIKPQLGLLIPFAFIAGRQWRAFGGATAAVIGSMLLSLLVFGIEPFAAMLELAPLYSSIASEGLVGWHKMGSVYASLSLAGLPATAAWIAHGGVALTALAQLVWVWRGDFGMPAKMAVLAAATVLVSPYIYIYDTVLLIIPFLWLAARETRLGLLVALWCIPLISIAQSWGYNETVNLMPVMPIALLVLIQRRLLSSRAAPAAAPAEPLAAAI